MLRYHDIHAKALEMWQTREMQREPRLRRMYPDGIDHASGAWGLMFAKAAEQMGWKPGDEIDGSAGKR